MNTITKYHKLLTARTILSRKDGWKTLLPSHCADLMLDYEATYGREAKDKLVADYGTKVTGVIADLAATHISNPKMNDILFNAMLRA